MHKLGLKNVSGKWVLTLIDIEFNRVKNKNILNGRIKIKNRSSNSSPP
jgi:hypothetical protein